MAFRSGKIRRCSPARLQRHKYDADDARRFLEALTRRLEVDPSFIMAAYEDTFYYLWRERRLPVNVDPLDSKIADPVERTRLARIFEQDLGKIIGYVLPLRRIPTRSGTPRWTSQPWFTRRRSCSWFPAIRPWAIGCRSNRCPGPSPKTWNIPSIPTRSRRATNFPNGRRASPICSPSQPSLPCRKRSASRKTEVPKKGESAPWVSRPALCVQVREGKLYVFMPPVEFLADYLDLVAAIEDTAAYLRMPVTIEGYAPPFDPRISTLKVTPDPGVIEVNIHPAESWGELVENTTELYHLARQTRLGTEKFLLDGRHSGTGGGNHVVIGGSTPDDSAFLRRPDLLRSLVGFWQNHPSLSYLFSGLFIGPTSQHPRVDEARTDSLYELADRLRPGARPGLRREHQLPGLVDRIFRNLLNRSHRQHPPHRNLHRQAVSGRQRFVAAGPGGTARLRNAAARAHESRPATAGAGADQPVLDIFECLVELF